MKEEKKSFEDKLMELEKIVKDLESGEVSLDDAISKFNVAMQLSKECNKTLDDATTTINKMLNDKGELEDFQVND